MEDPSNRLWSRFQRDAMENSPEFRDAFEKERKLFHELASKGELGERVTVMCCGDGREVELLADLHREFPQLKQLNGVDLLSISIDQVRERMRGKMERLPDVELRLLQEDATDTSIEPESQDTVTCMLTMVNFDDEFILKFSRHVYRILKPGGKFVFSVYNDKAFGERIKLYRKMNAPIESSDPKTGLVTFEEGFDEAAFSRQFRKNQFKDLVFNAGMDVASHDDTGITHVGVLRKQESAYVDRELPVWQQMAFAASMAAVLAGITYVGSVHAPREEYDPDAKWSEVGPGFFMNVNKRRKG